MLHDIAPARYNNDFAILRPEPEDKIILFRAKSVLVHVEGEMLHAPTFADFGIDTINEIAISEGAKNDQGLDSEDYEVLLAHKDHLSNSDPAPSVLLAHEDPHPRSPRVSTTPQIVRAAAVPVVREQVPGRDDVEAPYKAQYLFRVDADRYFFADLPASAIDALAEKEGWEFIPLMELQNYRPKPVRFALTVGYEYWTWYESSQFCGRCGARNVPDKIERMMRCPECGLMTFPKLFPAVIVGITREDGKVLATRYAGRPYANYALVAGFCEMGETVEQTVHREVMEEVGLRVKNLRYYKSQPWPDSSSLLFGFFCELDGSPEIDLDEHELSMAAWVDRDELLEDNDHSLTREMMRIMREGREKEYCIVEAGRTMA